ncbi:25546_t:CDS:2, partial [Gigaspora rosea]
AKAKAELDRKNREEAERKRNEELRNRFAELEKSGKVTLSGYITVQGGGVYVSNLHYINIFDLEMYITLAYMLIYLFPQNLQLFKQILQQFWKRRFFELRGKTLYLFRDETDKLPISKLELDGQVTGVTDAQSEVLILNSFKVDFRSSEPYYFFSDDKKNKELIVAAIGRYAK